MRYNLWIGVGVTLGLGGLACALILLGFILMPRGKTQFIFTALISGSIAAFHFASTAFEMEYEYVPANDPSVVPIISNEAMVFFVAVQSLLSLGILGFQFGQVSFHRHLRSQNELKTVGLLVRHIADMDLVKCREIQCSADHDFSQLEQLLFQIVANLELYRPFLPHHLFHKQVVYVVPQGGGGDGG